MILWIIWYCLNILFSKPHTITYRKPKSKPGFKSQKKPQWVINRIIEHKAIMNKDGCRKIAASFNRRFGDKETVSKSWVAATVCKHKYEILQLRKKLKNRIPKPQPINQIWGVDLSGKQDHGKSTHYMLGIIDHGSRFNLMLKAIPNKTSITLLRCLLDTIEQYDKPKAIRTDNEAIFTSRLFRFGLWLLRIKHQRTNVGCPWMNGRIERFFGTLKEKLNQIMVPDAQNLNIHLNEFRFWYNYIRTHQHIDDRTPFEAWSGKGFKRKAKFYSSWDGILTGFYHPPDG